MLRQCVLRKHMATCCKLKLAHFSSTTGALLKAHPDVDEAIAAGKPVVALESTIISHGMPYPQNVETAVAVEHIVKSGGAQPATVAILDGRLCIGLGGDQLEQLGQAGKKARKVSRRDMASCLASGGVGATTVSGTMVAAHAAGISVFVTGGIGGVHRGAETSFDISADLTELGRTPVAVVSAGVKSILDIPKTLEYLETQGVPVMALREGSTSSGAPGSGPMEFPAFFSPKSGIIAPETVETVDQAAKSWATSLQLGLTNGMMLAVPNPSPAEGAMVQAAVDRALKEAEAKGIAGRDVTPFLLARVAELTGGESLKANIALVKNNAAVGAKFAVALHRHLTSGTMSRGGGSLGSAGTGRRHFSTTARVQTAAATHPNGIRVSGRPVVLGGSVMDVLCRPAEGTQLQTGVSNPGTVTHSHGGVGRNITEVMTRLGSKPTLVTHVGKDAPGRALAGKLTGMGATVLTPVQVGSDSSDAAPASTPTYVAMLDGKAELVAAVADMGAFDTCLGAEQLVQDLERADGQEARVQGPKDTNDLPTVISGANIAVMDANSPADSLKFFAFMCAGARKLGQGEAEVNGRAPAVPLVFEPISAAKCVKILNGTLSIAPPSLAGVGSLHLLSAIKPNAFEVVALAEAWRKRMGLAPLPPSAPLVTPETEEEAAQERALADKATSGKPLDNNGDNSGLPKGVEDVKTFNVVMGNPQAQEAQNEDNSDTEGGPAGADFSLDIRVLAAAQTVLAGMLRPSGMLSPVSSQVKAFSWAVAEGAGLDTAPGGKEIMQDIALSACPQLFAMVPGLAQTSANAPKDRPSTGTFGTDASPSWVDPLWPGGVIEGRKHVWVSLGKDGLLWLSARVHSDPAQAHRASDLCAALPFFLAAQHPAVDFDFQMLPAPTNITVRKVTGAGDTLVGCTVWALSQGKSVAEALQCGLAGAALALQAEPQGGAVPTTLTGPQVLEQARQAHVPRVQHEYA